MDDIAGEVSLLEAELESARRLHVIEDEMDSVNNELRKANRHLRQTKAKGEGHEDSIADAEDKVAELELKLKRLVRSQKESQIESKLARSYAASDAATSEKAVSVCDSVNPGECSVQSCPNPNDDQSSCPSPVQVSGGIGGVLPSGPNLVQSNGTDQSSLRGTPAVQISLHTDRSNQVQFSSGPVQGQSRVRRSAPEVTTSAPRSPSAVQTGERMDSTHQATNVQYSQHTPAYQFSSMMREAIPFTPESWVSSTQQWSSGMTYFNPANQMSSAPYPSEDPADVSYEQPGIPYGNPVMLQSEMIQNPGIRGPSSSMGGNGYPRPMVSTPGQPDAQWNGQNSAMLMQTILENQRQQSRLVNAMHLPKADIDSFDGDPLDYYPFLQRFQLHVLQYATDSETKLRHLRAYCKGDAKAAISSSDFIPNAEKAYNLAMSKLKERFGQEHVIAQSWMQKVLNFPSMKWGENTKLMQFSDLLTNCVETLQALQALAELNVGSNLEKIALKLPEEDFRSWGKEAAKIRLGGSRGPTVHHLQQFITRIARMANDPVYYRRKKEGHVKFLKPTTSSVKEKVVFSTQAEDADKPRVESESKGSKKVQSNSGSCAICASGNHRLQDCAKFKSMSLGERYEWSRRLKRCFNCLGIGSRNHNSYTCYHKRCSVHGCNSKHHTLLHGAKRMGKSRNDHDVEVQKKGFSQSHDVQSAFTNLVVKKTALNVVKVQVKGDNDRKIETFALLDKGGAGTFVLEAIADSLGLEGERGMLSVTTLEKGNSEMSARCVGLTVMDSDGNNGIFMPNVFTRKSLYLTSDNVPEFEELQQWEHLKDLPLVCAEEVGELGLIIGQDVPAALRELEERYDGDDKPYATKTRLGWVLNGILKGNNSTVSCNFVQTRTSPFVENVDPWHSVEKKLDVFWRLEGDDLEQQPAYSREDIKVLSMWNETTKMIDGHYEMNIPFRDTEPKLPNNQVVAESRLSSTMKKLNKDPVIKEQFVQEMNKMMEKGWAEKIQDSEIGRSDGKVWFIPFHAVYNEKKAKPRIVFDASAKFNDVSLNTKVMSGPNLTSTLTGVLLRARKQPVVISADVESMFMQVRVAPEDRDVLRFLWHPGGDQNVSPVQYRMTRHLFGGVWSPSAASYALQRIIKDQSEVFDSDLLKILRHNFYVDDVIYATHDVPSAIEAAKVLREICATAGFRLTKFNSNSRAVLASIPEEDRASQISSMDLMLGTIPSDSVLGIKWDIENDTFGFKVAKRPKGLTRRSILSIVCSMYDPLGIVHPFTFRGRRILQEITKRNLDWDEEISHDLAGFWDQWLDELSLISELNIPRCILLDGQSASDVLRRELHHFADGSTQGYGTVCYLKQQFSDNSVHISFLMSKSRVAPIKTVSIPRLELAAATIAVKQDVMLRKELDIEIDQTYFWTDSTIVLGWISNETRRYKTYVANRLSMIHSGSIPDQWRYVPTELNPADDLTRGLSAVQLKEQARWLGGPEFIQRDPVEWPCMPQCRVQDDDQEVVKTKVQSAAMLVKPENDFVNRILVKQNTWSKAKRIFAWISRAVKGFKGELLTKTKQLSVQELDDAEQFIIQKVQSSYYAAEIEILKQGGKIHKQSPLKALDPILKDGILRVGGRLKHHSATIQVKHPVILPPKCHITELIISGVHQRGHVPREQTHNEVRRQFWITKGRKEVYKVLGKCLICKFRDANPIVQKMGELPDARLQSDMPPFHCTGVDVCGPFEIKRARAIVKRYVVTFICMTSCAVHLEVANSLDTDSFINCLRRFLSRKPKPKKLFSDNATNFHGAEKELTRSIEEWNQEQITTHLVQQGIEWHYNAPLASHQGGLWERSIRSFRRVMNGLCTPDSFQRLDDEGFVTLVCEAEFIMNNRPLTKVSDDIDDEDPITPNHLLLLRDQQCSLPPGIFQREDQYQRRRWRLVQYLTDQFWNKWRRDYLSELQKRSKWQTKKENLKPNDLVLMIDPVAPRNEWMIARVVQTYPGEDDLVRSVEVLARNGQKYTRPVQKLCLLESSLDDQATDTYN
jgi:hypothetical protein